MQSISNSRRAAGGWSRSCAIDRAALLITSRDHVSSSDIKSLAAIIRRARRAPLMFSGARSCLRPRVFEVSDSAYRPRSVPLGGAFHCRGSPGRPIKISGRDYQAGAPDGGYFWSGSCFILGISQRDDRQTLFLVLAELYGKHAFDAGKKCVPEQDAEFMALLGPHTEGLTKRMMTRWLAGSKGQLASGLLGAPGAAPYPSRITASATVTGPPTVTATSQCHQTGRMTVSALGATCRSLMVAVGRPARRLIKSLAGIIKRTHPGTSYVSGCAVPSPTARF
jgi:hypothetical protein